MPFGLKNVGATYQRMMTRMFRERIGHTMEVYIDDMVVKSKEEHGHVADHSDVFKVLRRHKLLLNADKCVFGVNAGKFLGYMITHRGIDVNPDQISTIERLKPPSNP
nr:retrovirus-related pol polyprotein from transposon opus [Quercus suber]